MFGRRFDPAHLHNLHCVSMSYVLNTQKYTRIFRVMCIKPKETQKARKSDKSQYERKFPGLPNGKLGIFYRHTVYSPIELAYQVSML